LTEVKEKIFQRNPGSVGSNLSKTIGALRILDFRAGRAAWFELTFIYRKRGANNYMVPALAARQARIIFRSAFSNQTIPWPPPVP
jgi:hypothetical protein